MNGERVASGQFSGDLDSTSSLKFGHRGNPSDTPGSVDVREFFLNGGIDEVELFVGRALSDAEIQSIFNAGTAGKCKGVPFKAFSADTKIRLEPQPNQQTFKLISKFLAGSESDGIDPLNEAVSFKVGTFSATIPAGSFRPDGDGFKRGNCGRCPGGEDYPARSQPIQFSSPGQRGRSDRHCDSSKRGNQHWR